VTQGGMGELLNENKNWLAKRESEITDENERRLALNYINAKLQLLNNRIATKIVDLNNQPNDEIRFGGWLL
jgi:transcription elongation factor GreB